MTIKKTLVWSFLTLAMTAAPTAAIAQDSNPSNLTSSPYTRYGFGKLGSVGNSSTRALGDAGIALRTNQYTNLHNPASLTAIDTLTMLFDCAMDVEWFRMSEGGLSETDFNAGFSYLTFHFPLWNRFAGAIAYTPYSMVGYEYGNTEKESADHPLIKNDSLGSTLSYTGNGGLQHFQLSLGWSPVKSRTSELSLGLSAGYICGAVSYPGSKYVSQGESNSIFLNREYSCRGWDMLLGAQFTRQLTAGKHLTVGATFAPKTHIGCDVVNVENTSTSTDGSKKVRYGLSAPMKMGGGVSYVIDQKLTVTADYSFDNWANVPGLNANLKKADHIYRNINRIAAGAEYRPKLYAPNYFQTCLYRVGFKCQDSYISEFGKQKELTASCGIGMPVGRSSAINMAIEYTHIQPSDKALIKEDFVHLTFGITFNEMMFYRSRLW